MRIALVNQPWSVCPPDSSADSIALVISELMRRLAPSCELRVYAKALPGRPKVETIDGVEFRRISARVDALAKPLRLLDKWRITPPTRPFYQSVFYHLGYASAVARDLRRSPCDVVHVHNFAQCARMIRLFNPTVRTVLHMHCDWLAQLDRRLVQRSLKHVDLVLGVSRFITDHAKACFPDAPTQFKTLYNGVDFERFASARAMPREKSEQRILYVGRLSPEKGVHVLLEAFSQIADKFPDAVLDLVGPGNVLSREFVDPGRSDGELERLDPFFRNRGSYAAHLKELIPAGIAHRVRFRGSLPHQDLPGIYAGAEMLVVPSVFDEPFGLPLAEAMAAGVPCIATFAGAFVEIIEPHRSGLLVPRANAAALAQAMTELLANRENSVAMGRLARARAAQLFSWDRNAEQLLAHYRNLADLSSEKVPDSGRANVTAA
jgi:glycosyltransferase involved in cell wall biosynthesis